MLYCLFSIPIIVRALIFPFTEVMQPFAQKKSSVGQVIALLIINLSSVFIPFRQIFFLVSSMFGQASRGGCDWSVRSKALCLSASPGGGSAKVC